MEDIYGLDLGYAAGARTALEHLGRILREGERPLCGATGFLDGHTGLVLATTERLLFVYKDRTPVDDPYEDIVAFRARAGVIGAILQVQDKQGRITIKQIHPRDRLVDFAAILQKGPEAYASAHPPVEATGPSLKGQERAVLRPAVPAIQPRGASAGMPGPVPAPPTTTPPPTAAAPPDQ